MMLLGGFIFALVACHTVEAHSTFTTLHINNITQGDGTCVRMPMTPNNATYPINDVSSNDLACGYGGSRGVARVCSTPQGSKLDFEWRVWPDDASRGSVSASHLGPCAVYMKAVSSAISDVGHGDGWFKIFEEGYDNANGEWCNEKIIKNNGLLSVNIPSDLAGGYYLIRPELLALHDADKTPPNPQFYTGCAQIFLESKSTTVAKSTVSIPGYVQAGDPSLTFNVWNPKFPYQLPGPPVYTPSEQQTLKVRARAGLIGFQDEGLVPGDCLVQNANWCGIKLDPYDTQDGCYNASANCWDQANACYASAPPTGSRGCHEWEDNYCTPIMNNCQKLSNFKGPPIYEPSGPGSISGLNVDPPSPLFTFTPSLAAATTTTTITQIVIPIPLSTDPGIPITNTYDGGLGLSADSLVTNRFDNSTQPASFTGVVHSYVTANAVPSQPSVTVEVPVPMPQPATPALPTSQDATCGMYFGTTCMNSGFGACCSKFGWCGVTEEHCGNGCQGDFGVCAGSESGLKGSVLESIGGSLGGLENY